MAVASKTTDNAAWKTTSDFCGSDARSRVARLTPRSASAGWECDESHAGPVPNRIPVTSETRNAKPRTGKEGLGSMTMARACGNAHARIMRQAAYATATPASPPMQASSTLSVSV